jgi:hypothetical protein
VDAGIVIPLLLLALVALALVLFVRRASLAISRTRRIERFQSESDALGTRIDGVLAAMIVRVDLARHGDVTPADIEGEVRDALTAISGGLEEARAIEVPAAFAESHAGMVAELAHAVRATEMVLHGCSVGEGRGRREHMNEAQTAIKRGYLNLSHAREALAEHVSDLAAAREPSGRKWRTSRI